MGDAIRIDGGCAGSGTSVFALDTVLEGDGLASDKLVITGDTSGETMLSLTGLESAGAEGATLAIDVVAAGGTSEAKTDGGWALSALTESVEVDLSGRSLTTESVHWAVGVGLGGRYVWSDRVDLFGEASYPTGLSNAGDTSALSANAGIKVVF